MTVDPERLEISADDDRLDLDWVHDRFANDTYWAQGRTREQVEQIVAASLCYGMYTPDGQQLAFARLVTDHVDFAWLSDVYVDRSARGLGLSKRLMERILADVRSWNLRRLVLATNGAEGLYRKFDFVEVDADSSTWMQIKRS